MFYVDRSIFLLFLLQFGIKLMYRNQKSLDYRLKYYSFFPTSTEYNLTMKTTASIRKKDTHPFFYFLGQLLQFNNL